MKLVPRKIRIDRKGFTLAETLIAILILLMVSAIVAGAIPTASSVFAKTVDAANAQLLLSTTMTKLRDELSTAVGDVNISDGGKTITYQNSNGYCKIHIPEATATSGILIYHGTYDPSAGVTFDDAAGRLLVSEEAATKGMIVSCSASKSADGKTIIFSNMEVRKAGYESSLAERGAFSVRRVA